MAKTRTTLGELAYQLGHFDAHAEVEVDPARGLVCKKANAVDLLLLSVETGEETKSGMGKITIEEPKVEEKKPNLVDKMKDGEWGVGWDVRAGKDVPQLFLKNGGRIHRFSIQVPSDIGWIGDTAGDRYFVERILPMRTKVTFEV